MAAVTAISMVVLIVSGTFAWASLNSQKVNEWFGKGANPEKVAGGTLHDDYFNDNGSMKQIYVENWGEEDLFVRIKLGEYMELGTGAGLKSVEKDSSGNDIHNPDNKSKPIRDIWTNIDEPKKWSVDWTIDRLRQSGDPPGLPAPWYRLSSYWKWEMGGQKVYYTAPEDQRTDPDYVDQRSPNALQLIDGKGNELIKQTLPATVMAMEAWKAEGSPIGNYWVIDRRDGWAYWAAPLKPGDATGLLLNSVVRIESAWQAYKSNVDFDYNSDYYYGINVHAQMATKDGTTADGALDNYKCFGRDGGWTDDGQLLMDKIVNGGLNEDSQPHKFTLAFGAGGTHQPDHETPNGSIPGGILDANTDTVSAQIKAGSQFYVSVKVLPGYVFDKWVSSDNKGSFGDATKIATTFIMPDSDVTVTATFKAGSEPSKPEFIAPVVNISGAIVIDNYIFAKVGETVTFKTSSTDTYGAMELNINNALNDPIAADTHYYTITAPVGNDKLTNTLVFKDGSSSWGVKINASIYGEEKIYSDDGKNVGWNWKYVYDSSKTAIAIPADCDGVAKDANGRYCLVYGDELRLWVFRPGAPPTHPTNGEKTFYTLTYIIGDGGQLQDSSNTMMIKYEAGSEVSLFALPMSDFRFDKWVSSDESVVFKGGVNWPSTTFTMPENDLTVTATFKAFYGILP